MYKWINGIKYDNNCAVEADRAITAAYILPGTKTIGCCAFHNCKKLTSVILPDELESIEDEAFYGCIGLKALINAFRGCPLQNAALKENGLTYWNNTLIGADKEIVSAQIKAGVTAIGDGAFSSCSGLLSVSIPDSVTEIGCTAFGGCTGLTSVKLPSGITHIGNFAFYGCTSLKKVTTPNFSLCFENRAFEKCPSLRILELDPHFDTLMCA